MRIDWLPIVAVLGAFAVAMFTTWVRHRTRDNKIRLQSEVYKQLIDKFGSGEEFARFAETAAGKDLLQQLASRPDEPSNPHTNILRSIKVGLILTLMGTALFVMWITGAGTDPDEGTGGVVLLGIGIAFLIGAALSYHLSKKWGLIKDEDSNPANQVRG